MLGIAAFAPGRLELALRIYALVVAAAVIALVLRALAQAFPPESVPKAARPTRRSQERPATLTTARNEVVLGIASSFDLHYRLVPRLRASAEALLASRRNVVLDSEPERARAILGPEAWELVRPDRAAPLDRQAKGARAAELGRVVDVLEAL
jgi:hypothetical protein